MLLDAKANPGQAFVCVCVCVRVARATCSVNVCAMRTRRHRQICCMLSCTGGELHMGSHVAYQYISQILISIDLDLNSSLCHDIHRCHTANAASSSRYQNPAGPVHSPVHRGAERLRPYRAAGWWILQCVYVCARTRAQCHINDCHALRIFCTMILFLLRMSSSAPASYE